MDNLILPTTIASTTVNPQPFHDVNVQPVAVPVAVQPAPPVAPPSSAFPTYPEPTPSTNQPPAAVAAPQPTPPTPVVAGPVLPAEESLEQPVVLPTQQPATLPVNPLANQFALSSPGGAIAQPLPTPQVKREWKFPGSVRLLAVFGVFATLMVGAALLVHQGQKPSNTPDKSSLVFPEQTLNSQTQLNGVNTTIQEDQTLIVNGDIRLQGALNFASGDYIGGFVQGDLTSNQSYSLPNASGEVCLSSNNCNYLTAAQLVATGLVTSDQLAQARNNLATAADLAALQGQLNGLVVTAPNFTAGSGIDITGEVIQNTGVLTLNGQSGAVALTGGSGILVSGTTLSNTGVITVNGQAGAVSFTGGTGVSLSGTTINNDGVLSLGGQTGALNLVSGPGISVSGLTISNNGVTSVQGLAGNVVFTAGSGIDITGTAVSNTGVTLLTGTANQVAVSAGTGSVTLSLPQNIAVASTPTFGGLTLNGALSVGQISSTAGLTVGNTNKALTLQGSSASLTATNGGNTVSLTFVNPTSNVVYRFTTAAAGTYDVCTTTGNCTGVGGGVTTPGGTAGTIPKFTSSQGIGDSIITDNGTKVTINGNFDVTGVINGQLVSPDAHFTGNVTVDLNLGVSGTLTVNTIAPTGAMTIGDAGQSLLLQGSAVTLSSTNSGITNSLVFATPSGSNKTITIPNLSGTVCLTSGNCAGVGGTGDVLQNGNSYGAAMTIGTNDGFALNFETNNSTVMTLLTNGNVGIGTSPTVRLDVLGDGRITGSLSVTGTLGSITTSSTGNNLDFSRAGSNYLTATNASGSLQLGAGGVSSVLTIGNNNTANTLNINGSKVAIGTATANNMLHIKAAGNSFTNSGIRLEDDATSTYFDLINDDRFRIGYNAATVLNLSTAGDLAIGSSAASARLHVQGGNALLDNTYGLQIRNNAATAISIAKLDSSNNLTLGATSGMANTILNAGTGSLIFASSTGTAMTILNSGYVGIGNTNPTYPLYVSGNIANVGGQYSSTGVFENTATASGYLNSLTGVTPNLTAGGHNCIGVGVAASTNNLTSLCFNYAGAGSTSNSFNVAFFGVSDLLTVQAGGNVGIGATSPGAKLQVTSTAAGTVGVLVKGAALQSANLQEWQNSAGTVLAQIDANGILKLGSTATGANIQLSLSDTNSRSAYLNWVNDGVSKWTVYMLDHDANLYIRDQVNSRMQVTYSPGAAGSAVTQFADKLVVKAAASQSANLQEWQNSAGTVLAKVSAAGTVSGTRIDANSTLGAIGFSQYVGAESFPRWSVSDGALYWGSGSLAVDTNLYRRNADELATNDAFTLDSGTGLLYLRGTSTAGTNRFAINVSGDAGYRYLQAGDGTMTWGDGTGVYDTNLYRDSADVLKTNDAFFAASNIKAAQGTANQVAIGAQGPAVQAGIAFGLSADAKLYRIGATLLETDSNLQVVRPASGSDALRAYVSGDAQNRFIVQASGAITWGSGALAGDTNLYRSGADTLSTDDAFTALSVTATANLIAGSGTAGRITLTPNGGTATIQFGSSNDTNLYRNAANTLRTSGKLYVDSDFAAYNGAAEQVWLSSGSAGVAGIRLGSSADTNLYRSAAGTLKTDTNLQVAGSIGIGAQPFNYGSRLEVTIANAGHLGQTIQGATSQTADLLHLQRADGAALAYFTGNGGLRISNDNGGVNRLSIFNNSSTIPSTTQVYIDTYVASNTGVIIRAVTSQTADIQQWQNVGGSNLTRVAADGALILNSSLGASNIEWTNGRVGSQTGMAIVGDANGSIAIKDTYNTFAKFLGRNDGTAGTLGLGDMGSLAQGQVLRVMPNLATDVGILIQGASSQSADLTQWKNSAGTILTAIQADGKLVFGPSGSQDTNLYRSAADTLKTDDSLVIRTLTNSTTAFQVQNASATSIFTADTTNSQIKVSNLTGLDTNGITVSGTSQAATTSWVSRTSAADNYWTSITYGNGIYVAVSLTGTGNRVMTSPDGITWTARTSAANNLWQSVTYGNGLFVAVSGGLEGVGTEVMTSPDGITWTSRTASVNNQWQAVTYGNGLFVAVSISGTGNRVMTSPDGITWTTRTSAADNQWRSVTYGNGLFVAVSQSGTGNRVMTSPDGITWTTRTSAADNTWTSIAYSNGLFVAVSGGQEGASTNVMTSPDGITWTTRTSAANNSWSGVIYGNGLFVAVSNNGTNRIMTSPDGITWTSRTAATSNTWTSVTYGNGLFVAVSADGTGNRVMTSFGASTNQTALTVQGALASTGGLTVRSNLSNKAAITWTNRTAATSNSWQSVTYGNALFVAVSSDGSGNRVMTSPDGITWTSRTSAANNSWTSVTYGNGVYVAVAQSGTGNRVMTSPDGITWTSRTSAADNNWQSVTYGNGLFVAVASSGSGNRVMTSPDGITWTIRTSAADNGWFGVTYGNGLYVAVSISGTIMTSPDGITWTTRTAPAANFWDSVAFGNGVFVAVSQDGGTSHVMTSLDGITWTSRLSATDNAWKSVVYGGGVFVAVTTDSTNYVMTSPDGITWTSRTGSMSNSNSVTYGNGLFIAVAGGAVMTSPLTDEYAMALSVGDTSGNVGIGTSNSTFKFSAVALQGAAAISSFLNSSTSDNTTTGVMSLRLGTAASGTSARFLQFYAASTTDANGTGVGRIRLNNTGVAYETGSADFAEYFDVTESVEPGDVIAVTSTGNAKATQGTRLLGVVSDTAAFVGNAKSDEPGANQAIVGLAGQVKTKVSTQNGAITTGDRLSMSSVAGVAMKANPGDATIGIALESYNSPGVARIGVVLDTTAAQADLQLSGVNNGDNVSFADLNVGGLAQLTNLTVSGNVTIQGKLKVTNAEVTGSLTIAGQFYSKGLRPTATPGTAAGASAVATVEGTDTAGTITIETKAGDTLTVGEALNLAFSDSLQLAPRVQLTPTNPDAGDVKYYISRDTTGFKLMLGQALQPGKTYTFDYFVIGAQASN